MIYLDNAATSYPKPPEVIRAVCEALEGFGNPSRSAHGPALAAARRLAAARTALAGLFGGQPGRVVFTKNVTEALNLAIASVKGHIVSSEAEHNSVLRPVHRRGDYTLVPVDALGRYTAADVAGALRPGTGAVVLGHASNLTGNVAPLAEIGALCRERGLMFIVDAAQTAGLFPLDMERCHIDALCFTGHKSLYGPQGTGGLLLSERFTPAPLLAGGTGVHSFEADQPGMLPEGLEAGTLNGHGIAGLLAGVEYVQARTPEALLRQANAAAERFLAALTGLAGLRLYGDYEAAQRAPIVTLNLGRLPSGEVAALLSEEHGIALRAGAHCAPLLHRRFGTERQGALRFSFSHMNTAEEAERAAAALRLAAKTLM